MPRYSVILRTDGKFCIFDSISSKEREVGEWVRFPECHVLCWRYKVRLGQQILRDKGILQRLGGTILYMSQSDGEADRDFVAQGSF